MPRMIYLTLRAYGSLARSRRELTLVGCWAHVRRGFHEALAETKLAAWFVRQIGLLYAVEKKLREQKTGPALRQAMRVWQSQPVLTRLHRAMELVRRRTLPQGLLGQAIDYTSETLGSSDTVRGGRHAGDRQQLDRECDSAQRTWKKELVVRWTSRSWRTQRGDLHLAGQLPAARHQPI